MADGRIVSLVILLEMRDVSFRILKKAVGRPPEPRTRRQKGKDRAAATGSHAIGCVASWRLP
jgi:hypothetical protein